MSFLPEIFGAKFLLPSAWWLLLPAAALLGVTVYFKKQNFLSACLRVVLFVFLIMALADPVKQTHDERHEVVALYDLSASVLPNAQTAMLESLASLSSSATTQTIFPFAQALAKSPFTAARDNSVTPEALDSEAGKLNRGETNIAAAISGALNETDSSSILLLSDGFETAGDALAAGKLAAQQGVRIFPIIPNEDVFRRGGLRVSALYAPVTADAGEIVEVRATVENSLHEPSRGKLEIWLESEKLFSQSITVPGDEEKLVLVKTPPTQGGLRKIRAVFHPERLNGTEQKDNGNELHRWVSIKEKAKILLLSGTHDDERLLKQLITHKGYSLEDIVADGSKEIPEKLDGYSSIILNNVAKRQLSNSFLSTLQSFVQSGGGLLLVGGDRSFGLGGYTDTKLEEMSPVKFVPPQTEKRRLTNAVALVIDKSGSMAEDNKIEAAKLAAMSSIQSLKDEDYISVIGFDAGPFVIIDVEPVAQAKLDAPKRLRNLTAAGKTNLLPALATARQRLQKAGTSRKHIIVLSDGKFPLSSEEYIAEINRLRNEGISISTVALGIEADIPFMKILAKYGKGAFYHTLDASQLPRIFVEDIKVASGEKTLQEGIDFPVIVGPSGVVSTSLERFPPVRGFVETLPKRGSEFELVTRKDESPFPILASWNYGSGKVIVYTSDANGRWSMPWVQWNNFALFWSEIIERIKDRSGSKTGEVDFDLRYSVERKNVMLDLSVFDEKLSREAAPKISAEIIEPGGETRQVPFQMNRKGRFEGRVENGRPGDYKVQITYGKVKLPALALSLGGELFGEVAGKGVNVPLLENLAYLTGGRINPKPQEVQGVTRTSDKQEHLFAPLALLAFLLLILEAFVREGSIREIVRTRSKSRPEKKAAPLKTRKVGQKAA